MFEFIIYAFKKKHENIYMILLLDSLYSVLVGSFYITSMSAKGSCSFYNDMQVFELHTS